MVLTVFIAFVILFLGIDAFVQYKRRRKIATQQEEYKSGNLYGKKPEAVPAGVYFDRSHTWAVLCSNGSARIGINDFFTHITGKLTGIKMKNPGEEIKKNEEFLSVVQNGKQLSLKAPVSGVIISVNNALVENALIINTSPYTEGWIYEIEPAKWEREVQFMFKAEKLGEWLRQEVLRLREFFELLQKKNESGYARIVLQDGGDLREGILTDFKSEIWEDFQTHFIDRV